MALKAADTGTETGPDPRSTSGGPGFGYQPALDGLRALAVLAVLLYHGDVGWARGGFLGVDAFFVLSGYLITSLLLLEHGRQGRIALRAFWGRRARRLLPALFLVLAAVALYGALVASPEELPSLWHDGLATLFYVQNWHLVLSDQSYFAAAAGPSTLRHAWSLAIEEQWYLIWPLLLGALLATTRSRRRLVAVVAGLAAGSALLMALLFTPGADPSRAYYGTDTRAQSLLVGSALAVVLAARPSPSTRAGRRALDLGALAALVAAVVLWSWTDEMSTWLYRGGLGAVALLVGLVIAAAVQPGRGVVRTVLSARPLVAIGLISYGLYLWHWPVYLVLSPRRTGLDGTTLLLVRIAVSFAVAVASYHLVERPFRYGAPARRVGWAAVPVGAAVMVGVLAVGTTGLVIGRPPPEEAPRAAKLVLLSREKVASRRALIDLANPPDIIRGVVMGDSVAVTLRPTSPTDPLTPALHVSTATAFVGCGIMDTPLRAEGLQGRQRNCRFLDAFWRQSIDIWRPNVVILLAGAWEVFDHRIDGEWWAPGSEAFRDALRRRLDVVLSAATRYGARLVILTTPCFQPPDTLHWAAVRGDDDRVAWLNRQWRAFAAEHPDRVSVLDLHGRVCPGGRFVGSVDGRAIRRADGVHLTRAGSAYVWRWLAPRIRELAPPADRIDRVP